MNKPYVKRAEKRRYKEQMYRQRQIRIAKQNDQYPRPYIHRYGDTEVVRYVDRGRYSRYLKRATSKRVRKAEDIPRNGGYKKVFDYWWKLY